MLNGLPAKEILWDALARKNHALSGVSSPDSNCGHHTWTRAPHRRYAIVIYGLEDCLDEDINDVLLGLHRLVETRVILLCFSATYTRASLPAEFYVSLDERKHEDEIQSYIVQEVWRPARIPHGGPQLVSLCGGSLLELW